jgi:eukaryotic-like serine/threonine-protein kinase
MPASEGRREPTRSPAVPVVEWPQRADDFTDEDATWTKESTPRRVRPTSMPPPIPRGTPAKPVQTVSEQSIGDWQIESVLGRGATGTVYAVTHRELGKRAALKISHASLDSGELSVKIFAREARIVQLVEHPAMPDVFATGSHDLRPFLVMERLSGETLSQRLERGAIDRTQAFDLLIDICDVLAVAHNAQVVHRDLKLDNVLVLDRPAAAGYRVKLLDWGFARVLGEEDPLRGMVVGALNYVAPEQMRGAPITPAMDVYSLGVLAYRLVLGVKPFSGRDADELMHRHIFSAPPDPTTFWPEIPKPLAQMMLRMLAKEPSERPTLHEVRAELAAARAARRWRVSLTNPKALVAFPMALSRRIEQHAIAALIALGCAALGAAVIAAT